MSGDKPAGKEWWKVVAPLLLAAAVLFTGVFIGSGGPKTFLLPYGSEDLTVPTWHDLGATPGGAKPNTPQGMVYLGGKIIYSESGGKEPSIVYELEIHDDRLKPGRMFTMPADARHISGLTWDGNYLFGIDHKSSKIYKINMPQSFATGKAAVLESTATGLPGAGSIEFLEYRGDRLFAITEFLYSGRTYLVPEKSLFTPGKIPNKAKYSYRNGFYNQGIMWAGDCYLYEANNVAGLDVIYKIDISVAVEKGDMASAIVGTYQAPAGMIEDITTDGTTLWTSDESTFRWYRTAFPFHDDANRASDHSACKST